MALNAEQLTFCEQVAVGVKPALAYAFATGKKFEEHEFACYRGASRWLKNAEVLAEVETIRDGAREGAVASVKEVEQFLTSVVFTPIGMVCQNSHLAQSVKRSVRQKSSPVSDQPALFSEDELGDSESVTVEEIKMPDKLKAAQMLLELKNAFPAAKAAGEGAAAAGDALLAFMQKVNAGEVLE